MSRRQILWLAVAVALAVFVAVQVVDDSQRPSELIAQADVPTVAPGVDVLAGVNLPMLIKLASVRKTEPLDEAIESAQHAGRKYINIASKLLSQEDDG